MRRNSFAIERAPPVNTPHTSMRVTQPNPTILARIMAFRAMEGCAFRAIQFSTAIPSIGPPEDTEKGDQRWGGIHWDSIDTKLSGREHHPESNNTLVNRRNCQHRFELHN